MAHRRLISTRSWRGAAVVVLAPTLLAACSGGDGAPTAASTTSTTAPTTTTTAAPTTTLAAPTTTAPPVPAGAPVAAADAAGLAAQVDAALRVIRDPTSTPAQLAHAGHTQQIVANAIVDRAELRDPVLERVAPEHRSVVAADVQAGSLLRSMITKPKDTLPDWRIVTPPPPDELLSHYRAAEAEFGVPWQYLAAINLVETRMGRIRGLSVAGAAGPMQFMPKTWEAYGGGGDINSYRDSIRAAARYLKANGAPTNMRSALWNYNHSYKYVDAVTEYAKQMIASDRAYLGYYHWQVYYLTSGGRVLLPEGWTRQ